MHPRKQVPDIAAHIDLWWLWVTETLAGYRLPADLDAWLREVLLPERVLAGTEEAHRVRPAPHGVSTRRHAGATAL
jgi:hypothetical protein